MRARGPHEVKPRQLRALVLLLVLLPLLPTTVVVRFLFESIANEQVEARERTKPHYQQFLDNASATLAARAARALPEEGRFDPTHPWDFITGPTPAADTLLLIQPDRQLALPAAPAPPPDLPAESLARGVLASGVHYLSLPPSGPVRWRFFSETPEPLFALHPRPPAVGPNAAGTGESNVLLIRRRQRLLDIHRRVLPARARSPDDPAPGGRKRRQHPAGRPRRTGRRHRAPSRCWPKRPSSRRCPPGACGSTAWTPRWSTASRAGRSPSTGGPPAACSWSRPPSPRRWA